MYYTCGIGNTKAGTINANQWTFVAATISASPNPTVTLYINGNMVSTYKYTGNTASSTGAGVANLTIGGTGYPACNDMNFTGSMANVNVYNTTLSAMQINQLYQDGLNGVPISNSRLVGWWPLNGNANDYSGNNNNSTSANVVYKNTNYNLSTNYPVASFNGQSSAIAIASTNMLNPTNAVTVVAWVYLNSYSSNTRNGAGIISKDTQYELSVNAFGNAVMDGQLPITPVYSNLQIPIHRWIFLAGGLNKSGTAYICVDSICKYETGSSEASLATSASPLYLGNGTISIAAPYLNGYIVNAQIYNTSISSSQIQQLYQQGLPQYKKITIELG